MGCSSNRRNRNVRGRALFTSLIMPLPIDVIGLTNGRNRCSNPQFTAEELSYQLTICKPSMIVAHSGNLQTLLSALKMAALPALGRIVLMDDPLPSYSKCDAQLSVASISSLLYEHRDYADGMPLSRYIMKLGEGKEKIAFLGWSSGTTGHPKVGVDHILSPLLMSKAQMTSSLSAYHIMQS